MFIIKIKDLQGLTTLGVYEWEKQAKRLVVLNLEMHLSDHKAGDSDNMEDAVDYAMLEERIVQRLENSSYNLIEKLVTDIGTYILSLDKRIDSVSIEADKPGALRQARSVSVSMVFNRPSS